MFMYCSLIINAINTVNQSASSELLLLFTHKSVYQCHEFIAASWSYLNHKSKPMLSYKFKSVILIIQTYGHISCEF